MHIQVHTHKVQTLLMTQLLLIGDTTITIDDGGGDKIHTRATL